jgi:alkylation response protein AidB-like acyl-CoA dehydrogenase
MTAPTDAAVQALAEAFERYARTRYPFERSRAAAAAGWSTDAWADYAAQGWLAMALAEHHGGIDADARVLGALMQTVGRHLLMEPLLASAVLGTASLRRSSPACLDADAPQLAAGALRVAVGLGHGALALRDDGLHGELAGVLHGDDAQRYVVGDTAAGLLCLVEPAAVQRRAYRLVDGRRAALLRFHRTPVLRLGGAEAAERLWQEAAVALCAETLGAAEALVDATAAHLKVRKQFGRTLGSNQVLAHRMSELYILREEIRALTAAAQQALAAQDGAAARAVAAARAYGIRAARSIANEAVQMHGGIGITEELPVSHHFRRLMVNAALFGGREAALRRLAAAD